MALEGRVVHIEDIRVDPDFAVPEAVRAGRRTNLGVPLLREAAVIGTIGLARNRAQPFTEREASNAAFDGPSVGEPSRIILPRLVVMQVAKRRAHRSWV